MIAGKLTRGRALAGAAVLAAVALAVVLGSASSARGSDPATRATIRLPNATLLVWRNTTNGRLTLSVNGSGTYDVVSGTTLTTVDDGEVSTVDTYETAADVWVDLSALYGVSQASVDDALAHGSAASEPAQSTASAQTLARTQADGSISYTEPYLTDVHYGDDVDHHLARLEADIGFGIPKVYSLDGYPLIDSAITNQFGPDTDVSGNVASLWYGSRGSSDSALTVNLAKSGTAGGWGSTYQTLLTRADLVGANYSATKVGDNQVVFRKGGSTYVSITTTWAPSDAEWATLIAPFAG